MAAVDHPPKALLWLGRWLLAAYTPLCLAVNDSGAWDSSDTWTLGGHAKYQFIYTSIPADSAFDVYLGGRAIDHNLETRLSLAARRGSWEFNAHPQLIAVHSDRLGGLRQLTAVTDPGASVISDARRWFNLTHELTNEGKNAALLRLDRLNVSYVGDKTVLRFGRQAISWGNGLLFTPMDIFNPFDPAAVDKEYKTGDDMLYGQYLLDNGSDLQGVAVVRRDAVNGDVDGDVSSVAAKYHGFAAGGEYDVLAARHYGDTLLALGFSADIGGAVWRGDLVWTDSRHGGRWSAVAGASYSGVTGGHNWTGFVEYFYNGFGQPGGDYSPAELASNPELLRRLARGELFTLGRHYLGVSLTIEMHPLLNVTPNFFINLSDPSALAQVVAAYAWKQDIQLLAAVNIPIGADGSEYGGIESGVPGAYYSYGPSVFAQLAWYF
jgi:hypothetical protein